MNKTFADTVFANTWLEQTEGAASKEVIIAVLDRNGEITAVNQAWERFAEENGAPEAVREGIGINYLDACHQAAEDGSEDALQGIQAVLQGIQNSFSIEYPCHSPDKQRWFIMNVSPLGGRQGGAVVCHINVTANKQAETALHDSHRQLRSLFDHSLDAFLLADDDARYVDANPAAMELLGYDRAELLQMSVWDITPGANSQTGRELWRDFISQGSQSGEYTALRKDGSLREVEYRAVANVLPGLHLSILRDVTERKLAEDALRQSEERYRRLVSVLPAAIYTCDAEGVINFYNERAAELWGRAPRLGDTDEKFCGSLRLYHSNGQLMPHSQTPMAVAVKTGQPARDEEVVIERPDGSRITVLVNIDPLFDEQGQLTGAINVFQDITRRKEAEQSIREHAAALETINRVNLNLASELDLDQLIQFVTDAGRLLTGARFGAFFHKVTGPDGETYRLYTLSGAPREAFEQFPMPRNTPVFHPTFTGQGIVRSPDITQDPRYGKVPPYFGLPEGHLPVRSYLAVPVISRTGEIHGGLLFGHPEPGVFTEQAEKIIAGVAAQAAIAIDNAQMVEALRRWNETLEARVRERTQELAEMQRLLIDSVEAERVRLARELHDGPMQQIYGVVFNLASLDEFSPETEPELPGLREELNKVNETLRALTRELRPNTLVPFGLSEAIRDRIERFQQDHIDLNFQLDLKPDYKLLPEEVRLALYRIFQVALTNAIRHANASRISVHFWFNDEQVLLEVKDDGRGFQVPERWITFAREGHLGLIGAAERAEAIGGELQVDSHPGQGTSVRVVVPRG